MKKLVLFVFLLTSPLYAQNNAYQPQLLTYRGAPQFTCVIYQQALDILTGNFYVCDPGGNAPTGSWTLVTGAGSVVTGCTTTGGVPYENGTNNTLTCSSGLIYAPASGNQFARPAPSTAWDMGAYFGAFSASGGLPWMGHSQIQP